MENNLKNARLKKGLTLQQVADKLNISRSAMSLYENEKRELNRNVILQLSKIYNVTTDYLLGNEQLPATVSTGVPEKVTPEKAKEIWLASLAPDDRETINYYFMLSYNDRQKVNGYIMAKLSMAEI